MVYCSVKIIITPFFFPKWRRNKDGIAKKCWTIFAGRPDWIRDAGKEKTQFSTFSGYSIQRSPIQIIS